VQAFVDESERGLYLVAAVLLDSSDIERGRRVLRELRKPGQRRVHFAKESDSRRRTILSALARLPIRVRLYECGGAPVPARATCLAALVDDLGDLGADRLVIEKLDTQVRADVATIRGRLAAAPVDPPLVYQHLRAYEEPLLWAADAVAWAYGAGPDWRRRMAAMLDKAVRLDA
jgi:hypothetical protein